MRCNSGEMSTSRTGTGRQQYTNRRGKVCPAIFFFFFFFFLRHTSTTKLAVVLSRPSQTSEAHNSIGDADGVIYKGEPFIMMMDSLLKRNLGGSQESIKFEYPAVLPITFPPRHPSCGSRWTGAVWPIITSIGLLVGRKHPHPSRIYYFTESHFTCHLSGF